MTKTFLVTGGMGFIGSALCRRLAADPAYRVVVLDKLTYAGNPASLAGLDGHPRYRFVEGDIADGPLLDAILVGEQVDVVVNLAAESHVDRSIDDPAIFVETNVVGTFRLLEAARRRWRALPDGARGAFRFHHVSTDEVFGSLELGEGSFTEDTPYDPSSPYSASKAASDHFVTAWARTYGLPIVLSNCTNNYGPRQFPEKLIPLTILNALEGRALPVYGAGRNVRDWLFVDDHARALERIALRGVPGRRYNVGARSERSNLAVVEAICDRLDALSPLPGVRTRRELITFVPDRPGHDLRYAIDPSRVEAELGWRAAETFGTGLDRTIRWYLDNESWWRPLREKRYAGGRLGLAEN